MSRTLIPLDYNTDKASPADVVEISRNQDSNTETRKMEKFNLGHSLQNIPIPSKLQYQRTMVGKVESFVGRLRWKLFAIQNPGMQQKTTYGFNTTNSPPQLKELK